MLPDGVLHAESLVHVVSLHASQQHLRHHQNNTAQVVMYCDGSVSTCKEAAGWTPVTELHRTLVHQVRHRQKLVACGCQVSFAISTTVLGTPVVGRWLVAAQLFGKTFDVVLAVLGSHWDPFALST